MRAVPEVPLHVPPPSTSALFARSRPRLIVGGLAVTILILLVVVASRSLTESNSAAPTNTGPIIAIAHAIQIVGIAIEILVLLLILVLLRLSRRRRNDEDEPFVEQPRMHWAAKLVMVALPILLLAGTIFAIYQFRPEEVEPTPVIFGPPPLEGFGAAGGDSSAFALAWWEYAAAAALAGLVLIGILRAFRSVAAPLPEPPPRSRARILSRAVAAGLEDAERETDPRRAVIAAYAAMEHILASSGLPRRQTEAPREYMARLFSAVDRGSDAVRTLTDLFEQARFSHHAIAPAMKERAIAALVAIREELQTAP